MSDKTYRGSCFCGAVEVTVTGAPAGFRKWCKTCGGHVLTDHPPLGLIDVYAAVLRDFPFEAGVHVNYGATVLRIKDGATKLKDFPKEFGGSGESVSE